MLDVMEFTYGTLTEQLVKYIGKRAEPKLRGDFKVLSPQPYGAATGNFVKFVQRIVAYPANQGLQLAPEYILTEPDDCGVKLQDVTVRRMGLPIFSLTFWGSPELMTVPIGKFDYMQMSFGVEILGNRSEELILILSEKKSAIYRIGNVHHYT